MKRSRASGKTKKSAKLKTEKESAGESSGQNQTAAEITPEAFRNVVTALDLAFSDEEINSMVNTVKEGAIEYDDCLEMIRSFDKGCNEVELKNIFKIFSEQRPKNQKNNRKSDGRSLITFEKLKAISKELGDFVSDDELNQMILVAAGNKTFVSEQDFLDLMLKPPAELARKT